MKSALFSSFLCYLCRDNMHCLLEIGSQKKLELDGEGDTFYESSAIWVQTSEIQCQTGLQKGKRTMQQKRTALMFEAEQFTPTPGSKINPILHLSF